MRGLIITLAVLVIASAARVLWPRATFDASGWRAVLPGPLPRLGLTVGLALTLLTAWVWLFVGSRRADAAEQLLVLSGLNLAFGAATLLLAWHQGRVRRLELRWRGDELAWRDTDGGQHTRRFADLTSVARHPLHGVVLHFSDGARLPVDPLGTHALPLLQALNQRARR